MESTARAYSSKASFHPSPCSTATRAAAAASARQSLQGIVVTGNGNAFLRSDQRLYCIAEKK